MKYGQLGTRAGRHKKKGSDFQLEHTSGEHLTKITHADIAPLPLVFQPATDCDRCMCASF